MMCVSGNLRNRHRFMTTQGNLAKNDNPFGHSSHLMAARGPDSQKDCQGYSNKPAVSNGPPVKSVVMRKKVRFADAEGLDLSQTRQLPLGSEETPPYLDVASIMSSMSISGNKPVSLPVDTTYTIGFPQPVSDFPTFMANIKDNCVQLESAIVKDGKLIGTVKVKNLAFDKTVLIRLSYDNWRTVKNIQAHYVSNTGNDMSTGAGPTHQGMDTFSFEYDLSSSLHNTCDTIQFAVCYRCQGSEFWDNNSQKNYRILVHNSRISSTAPNAARRDVTDVGKFPNFPGGININWSEFAVWNHLDNDFTPYW